jgi:hypothetical protein
VATFRQAHQALRDYTERFNRLALDLANRGQDAVTVEQQAAIGPYPQGIPYQWRRRMPDVVSISPSTILTHRAHLDRAQPRFCGVLIEGIARPYQCPVGFHEYTGLTRQDIDG